MSSLVFEFAKSAISKALGKDAYPATFTIGDRLNYDNFQSIWSVHKGTKKDDGSPLTVFVLNVQRYPDSTNFAKNGLKRFKTIKHPMILKLHDVHETEALIAFATEECTPLSCCISQNNEPNAICFGLFRVASVLEFLQEKAKLIHGNIRMDSVFVTPSGEWKLGGLDVMSATSDPSSMSFISTSIRRLPGIDVYLPPHIKNGSLAPEDYFDNDRLGFACLIWEVYNGRLRNLENLSDVSMIPRLLSNSFRRFNQSGMRQSRLDFTAFLQESSVKGAFFDNPLIHMSVFLENIAIKEAHEKESFLNELDSTIDTFPITFAKFKVLPELLNALEYSGAGTKALIPILKISAKMDQKEFDQRISPVIVKLFASTDRVLRVALCEHLGKLSENLNPKVVNDNIFPNLMIGCNDTNAIVREATLKAVVSILPKLNEKIINNDLLKHLAKLQGDEQPGIRTNTTICLGKLCKYLNESIKKRILIPAFTRALQDPFPPARNAGLLAITATVEFYEPLDVAHRLIPMISPLTQDPDINVKKQSVLALENLFKKLKGSVADAIEQQQKDIERQIEMEKNSPGGHQQNSAAEKQESWGTWATSLSSKLISTAAGEKPANETTAPTNGNGQMAKSLENMPPLNPVKNGIPSAGGNRSGVGMSLSNRPNVVSPSFANQNNRSNTFSRNNSSSGWGASVDFAPVTSAVYNNTAIDATSAPSGWDDEFDFDDKDDWNTPSNKPNTKPTTSSASYLTQQPAIVSEHIPSSNIAAPNSAATVSNSVAAVASKPSNNSGWNEAFEEW